VSVTWLFVPTPLDKFVCIFDIKYTMMRDFECKQLRIKMCIVLHSECSFDILDHSPLCNFIRCSFCTFFLYDYSKL
jgi:hypothetical protein